MDTENTAAPAGEQGRGKTMKIVGAVVVILFAVAFGLFVYRAMTAGYDLPSGVPQGAPGQQRKQERAMPSAAETAPPVVKNADGVVDAIAAEADAEMISVGQELSSEESLAGAEAESLNDLNQSYDDTQY
jgi:flagellar basal body-associated protein FliL